MFTLNVTKSGDIYVPIYHYIPNLDVVIRANFVEGRVYVGV